MDPQYDFESCFPIKRMRGVITTMVMAKTPEEGHESAQALYLGLELALLCMAAVTDTPSALFGEQKHELEAFKAKMKHYMPILIGFSKGLHEAGGCPETGGIHANGECGVEPGKLDLVGEGEAGLKKLAGSFGVSSPAELLKIMEDSVKRLESLDSPDFQKESEKMQKMIEKDIDDISDGGIQRSADEKQNQELLDEIERQCREQKKKDGGWQSGPSVN